MLRKEFNNELQQRRLIIVTFLYNIIIIAASIATLWTVGTFITQKEATVPDLILRIATILITIFFLYIRVYLIKRNLALSYYILASIFFLIFLHGLITSGIDVTVPYVLIILVILSSSIVLSIKRARMISYLGVLAIVLISILQYFDVITYKQTFTENELVQGLILATFILAIIHIARAGYSQIEHSYQQAYNYAKKLEEINLNLEKIIEQRTMQLRESFERQAESVYTAAVMGSIAQPLIHDISTPLSSLEGAVVLFEEDLSSEDKGDILERTKRTLDHLKSILTNARDLMNHKIVVKEFTPSEVIDNVLFVLKDNLQKGEIKVEKDIDQKIKMNGVVTLFSRMAVNIIQNAVEELLNTKRKDRLIKIKGYLKDNDFILEIEDNGRGINEKYINKIFDPDFTSKTTRNMGFGLAFVKTSIEKYFKGSIDVKSNVNEYTKFTLKFSSNVQV